MQQSVPNGDHPSTVMNHHEKFLAAKKKRDEEDRVHWKIGLVINGRFKIVEKIGSGAHGAVFAAEDMVAGTKVAVKFTTMDAGKHAHSQFDNECAFYDVVQAVTVEAVSGVPRMLWHGHEYNHNVLIMDLLGPSLEELFAYCDRDFSPATVFAVGRQMVERVRAVHDAGFVHRDIKPANFAVGLGENAATVYLIDFGLARRYRFYDGNEQKHVPFGEKLSEVQRESRRLCSKKEVHNHMKNMKEGTSVREQLCVGRPEVADFLLYCRGLRFEQKPDYDFLTGLLVKAARRVTGDDRSPTQFDWARLTCNPRRRFNYDCRFKWTLPIGQQPHIP